MAFHRTETVRADIYQEVTDRIIADLEAGVASWAKPWNNGVAPMSALPVNHSTGRAYSGVNILILWGAAVSKGYRHPRWLTFKQASDLGGCVRKGEKGTMAVYADRFIPEAEKARAESTGDDARSVAFLKRFFLFNVEQIDGLGELPVAEPMPEGERDELSEALIEGSGISFRCYGDKAFYSPDGDFVVMPHRTAFPDPMDFYRTSFHELTHATGHASRLGRTFGKRFGDKDYGREELVAELGAAFISASLGIAPTLRHSEYLGSWLRTLREDNRAIFKAASAASKAAEWLLSRAPAALEGVRPRIAA
jgi:antirestriction protein ArdC